ncbi:MAG: hypothetical protein WDZ94_05460 [Patescibacteria group bacterium]
MKSFFSFLALFISAGFLIATPVSAYWVNDYYRSDGTHVSGHYRSRPNAYTHDNYSYTGPSASNGYGYNDSYYSGSSYSDDWYTPSYNDSGWEYENNWSDSNSGRSSYYNSYDYSGYDSIEYDYGW